MLKNLANLNLCNSSPVNQMEVTNFANDGNFGYFPHRKLCYKKLCYKEVEMYYLCFGSRSIATLHRTGLVNSKGWYDVLYYYIAMILND